MADSLRQIIENAQQLLNQLGEPLAGKRGRGKSARIMKKTNEPGIRRGPVRPTAWARRTAATGKKK